ncbi:MAG TPA: type II secretion system protein [Lacipirellulaceae bacterium]|nr:type II secretion system protein [Lacipirellulaceae bacterium]
MSRLRSTADRPPRRTAALHSRDALASRDAMHRRGAAAVRDEGDGAANQNPAPRRAVGSRLEDQRASCATGAALLLPQSPVASRQPLFSPPRRGLTLIELLVTIVILVTLLGAVLPAVSPNNDARKIREASRQLVAMLGLAQAQAARDGRPVGVGFSDADGDGIALEAYLVAEPAPFTGFASDASLLVRRNGHANAPQLAPNDAPLVNLIFGHGVGGEGIDITDPADVIPPAMFRGAFINDLGYVEGAGDLVEVGNEVFELLTNDLDETVSGDASPNVQIVTLGNVQYQYLASQKEVTARWLTHRGRRAELSPRGGKAYRIRRRPTAITSLAGVAGRTPVETIQFPRGIGLDFDVSGVDRYSRGGRDCMTGRPMPEALSVLFSPNGSVDSVYVDGIRADDRQTVYFLLGRVENGNPPLRNTSSSVTPPPRLPFPQDRDYVRYDFRGVGFDRDGEDELRRRRQEVNLLNGDSRWVAVAPSGRYASADNVLIAPREPRFVQGNPAVGQPPILGDLPEQQRERQRWVARSFAAELRRDVEP